MAAATAGGGDGIPNRFVYATWWGGGDGDVGLLAVVVVQRVSLQRGSGIIVGGGGFWQWWELKWVGHLLPKSYCVAGSQDFSEGETWL